MQNLKLSVADAKDHFDSRTEHFQNLPLSLNGALGRFLYNFLSKGILILLVGGGWTFLSTAFLRLERPWPASHEGVPHELDQIAAKLCEAARDDL